MNKRITSAVAVYLVAEDHHKNLLVGRRYNTGYQDGNYQFFAGHVELGELPMVALQREMREELGIEIRASDLTLVHTSSRPKHDETGNRIDLYFKAAKWTGNPRIAEEDKCDDLAWVNPNRLPKNFVPHVRHAIICIQANILYSELDLPWMRRQKLYGKLEEVL
jgi:8-oxo-dGTP pyrophosphatase MutT (NUDIX family)